MMSNADRVLALAGQLAATSGADPVLLPVELRGFWQHNKEPEFPPAAIRTPSEWLGGARLHIACTQTELSAREQRRLVAQWCEVLPTLSGVSLLWFTSRVPQELFDAACRLPGLVGLYCKWNGIHDLSALEHAERLACLHLGDSASLRSLEPVAVLDQLVWLEVGNAVKAFDLEPLRRLTQLQGLGFTGREGKAMSVASLGPLAGLRQLRWLHLGAIRVADGSLRALASLERLQWLGLPNQFAVEEFAWLSTKLPDTICSWLKPYARFHPSVFPCRACGTNWKVMASGKPSQLLCPTCDSMKLAKRVLKFEHATGVARAEAVSRGSEERDPEQ